MQKIIECIPNFSEGRDKKKIASIIGAIVETPGIILLDSESDASHNRSVVTFIGEPEAVFVAAFACAKKAAELINLDEHKGEHPRMGATDVIPFVPIRGVTIEECIKLAEKLGQKIGSELKIPVYFYEKAAKRPERENLAIVRKGEYEGIKKEIGVNPDRAPDAGPSELGTAGATAIGVRDPLVAFNVNLKTEDLNIAKEIAKKIRFKDGGFKCVKAMGFALEDKKMVQVSMNLTNYKETPPHVVFDAICAEAKKRGVEVAESEMIGLVPEEALIVGAKHFLMIKNFSEDQILENILRKKQDEKIAHESVCRLASLSLKEFIDNVASKKPVPGGGSVSAMAGAIAAALISMVANLTLASAKYSAVHAQAKRILDASEKLRSDLIEFIDKDSQAFENVMATYRLPESSNKKAEIQKALIFAVEIPMQTAQAALDLLPLLEEISRIGNKNALSDCGVAMHMLETAVKGAILNVKINLKSIENEMKVKEFSEKSESVLSELSKGKEKISGCLFI